MGPCLSKDGGPSPPTVFKVVHDRRCEEDYAYDDKRDKIGEGVQGVVFAAKDRRTGADVAVKRTHIGVFGSNAARASAFGEIETLSYIDHPNVVKLLVRRRWNAHGGRGEGRKGKWGKGGCCCSTRCHFSSSLSPVDPLPPFCVTHCVVEHRNALGLWSHGDGACRGDLFTRCWRRV